MMLRDHKGVREPLIRTLPHPNWQAQEGSTREGWWISWQSAAMPLDGVWSSINPLLPDPWESSAVWLSSLSPPMGVPEGALHDKKTSGQGSRYCCGEHDGLGYRAVSNAEGPTFSKTGTQRTKGSNCRDPFLLQAQTYGHHHH